METLHQPGDIINQRYRIVAPLGQGSMGTTYEAEDLTNYQRVAIKAVSLRQTTDWKILELFEREARVLANLNHPNIPNYLDYFYVDSEADRIFYLVRELVGGDSLANLVQRGWNLEEERVQQIAIQVLETLEYLHGLNPPIIHRDIKPENLIVDRSGKVFLVDFGAVRDVYRQTISLSNTFVGTLGYMAPEQFRGQVKPASDLYSLGATLVFILTKRSPVDLPQVRMKIDFRNRVSISPQFTDWLDKMLEPELEERFQWAMEALNALYYGIETRGDQQFVHQRQAASNIVSQPHRRPFGTKIVLKNNGRSLLIDIPKTREEIGLGIFLLIATLPFLIPCFLMIYDEISGLLGAILIVLIFSVVSIIFLILILGKTKIQINQHQFCLKFTLFDLTLSKAEFLINNIDRIGLSGTGNKCTIWAGAYTKYFGGNLSQIEKEWLVEEIQSFLNKISQ